MINPSLIRHKKYVSSRYPGATPEELIELTAKLFNRLAAEAQTLNFPRPTKWTDPRMMEFLDWKLKNTTLGLEVDHGNALGLATERTLLRWVRDTVYGMGELRLPFGLDDHVAIRNQFKRGTLNWKQI